MKRGVTFFIVRILMAVLLLASARLAQAQGFDFVPPASAEDPTVPALMRDLAERILPVYQEKDPERYLVNLAALQLVSGNPGAAAESRNALRERRAAAGQSPQHPYILFHDLVVRARAAEQTEHVSFADAFGRLFRENVSKLGDRESHAVTRLMGSSPAATRDALQAAFDRIRPKGSVDDREAMDLVWTYIWFDAYRRTGATLPSLARGEATRRYLVDEDVHIKGRGGVEIVARVVRPRQTSKPLAALLEFTIDPSQDDAHASAAHGYAGVVAYTRGKKHAKGRITPFEHDGEDARLVIEWIAAQPWSDGRVAMIGDGYAGFAAWAALRKPPAALKAIATADAMAPGIDFPMEGRIVRNAAYRWAQEHTQGLGEPAAHEPAYWSALDLSWFRSGRAYRDFDRIAKDPNRVFRRWIGHPSYDGYWQRMIPLREQFAKVEIPVLSITGYYAQGEVGALHYFEEHTSHAKDAQHALLIGPWDESAVANRPARMLRGYAVEPASRVDLAELRFEWLDHVLGGGPKPELLKDRVNWWAMGTGEWRHAPTIDAMGGKRLRLYLETDEKVDARRLLDPLIRSSPRAKRTGVSRGAPPAEGTSFQQMVDRKDRGSPGVSVQPPVLSRQIGLDHAVKYLSDPLPQSVELGGLLSGQLDVKPSRMDMDLNVTLYELLSNGEYLLLCDPYEFRASYARDRVKRRLLQAGVRQKLTFKTEQLMSRRLHAGSRMVLVIGINHRADRQVNYGIGDDVSAESLKRAKAPLKIRWYPDSYIELPVRP